MSRSQNVRVLTRSKKSDSFSNLMSIFTLSARRDRFFHKRTICTQNLGRDQTLPEKCPRSLPEFLRAFFQAMGESGGPSPQSQILQNEERVCRAAFQTASGRQARRCP